MLTLTQPSLQVLNKSQVGGISLFQISDQSLINKNCQNSRTSNDIAMNLGPVAKLDKKKKLDNVKKIDDDAMSANYDVIVIFLSFYIFFNSYLFVLQKLSTNLKKVNQMLKCL